MLLTVVVPKPEGGWWTGGLRSQGEKMVWSAYRNDKITSTPTWLMRSETGCLHRGWSANLWSKRVAWWVVL